MINTIYSNLFEGLQQALFVNIERDLMEFRAHPERALEPITVVVPNPSVAERLKLSMASHFKILARVNFISIGEWLRPAIGLPVGMGNVGDALQWAIWAVLKDEDFKSELARKKEPGGMFLLEYLADKNDTEVFELAMHIAGCFVTYASYRLDWVLTWLGDGPQSEFEKKRTERDFELLEKKPHYAWQRLIWKYLEKLDWEGIRILKQMRENIGKLSDLKGPIERSRVHIFAPFSFAPTIFPFIGAVGGKDDVNNIWLYILNPSQEYWFEWMPKNLFDWETLEEEKIHAYLTSNAASTRAMTDRLYAFLHGDLQDPLLGDFSGDEFKAFAGAQQRRRLLKSRKEQEELLEEGLKKDEQMFFLDFGTDSMLHSMQSAILHLDERRLPEKPNQEDHSFRVIKAPTPMREVENIVDMLHSFFADDKLKASDILVVTPDIEKYAPLIDGVFSSLPKELQIPYRIIGRTQYDSNLVTRSITDLGNLLLGEFTKTLFEEWIELPAVLDNLGLDVGDAAALKNWLNTSGFRYGFNDAHLHQLGRPDESDGTLHAALQRLSLGYMLDSDERSAFDDILSVSGDEDSGFAKVSDDGGRVLFTLLRLAEKFEKFRGIFFTGDTEAEKPVQEWADIAITMVEEFFPNALSGEDGLSFVSEIRNVARAAAEVIHEMPVTFRVFWHSVDQHIKFSVVPFKRMDAVTFAPVAMARGLPYKVIFAIGFSEDSKFPGKQRVEEINLLSNAGSADPELARKGDRDSRKDNRNIFIDLLLATRERFIVSYSIGTAAGNEKNPSPVITDLLDFLQFNTDETLADGNHKWISESVTVKLSLNRYSPGSFKSGGAKFWKSPRREELNALKEALKSDYMGEAEVFADCGIPLEKVSALLNRDKVLTANLLLSFFKDPLEWAEKILGVSGSMEEPADRTALIVDKDDKLFAWSRNKFYLERFREGKSKKQILEFAVLDPRFGEKCIREKTIGPEIEKAAVFWSRYRDFLEEKGLTPLEKHLSWQPIKGTFKFVEKVEDKTTDLYSNPKGELYFVDLCHSKSQVAQHVFRSAIWAASGLEHKCRLFSLSFEKEDEARDGVEFSFSQDDGRKITEMLVLLFEAMVEHLISYRRPPYQQEKPSYSPLIRGNKNLEESLSQPSQKIKDVIPKFYEKKKPANGKSKKKEVPPLKQFVDAVQEILDLVPKAQEGDVP